MIYEDDNLADLQSAMLRARAMGFERTAAAMQRVLDEMMANRSPDTGTAPPAVLVKEDVR